MQRGARGHRNSAIFFGIAFVIALFQVLAFLTATNARSDGQQSESSFEVALFYRCYAHIVGKRPDSNHPLLAQIKRGENTAIDACMAVFDKAQFRADGKLKNPADPEAIAVLENFHRYHRKWFSVTDILSTLNSGCDNTAKVMDEQEPALFVTRAMFGVENSTPLPYSSIVTGSESLQSIRSNGPNSSDLLIEKLTENLALAETLKTVPEIETGTLLGVTKTATQKYSIKIGLGINRNTPPLGTWTFADNLAQHYGGGIIGTQPYLLMNMGMQNARSDGGVRVARRWSQSLMKDLVCRDLPVIRRSDAAPYVQFNLNENTPPFRGNIDCMQCHASIDNMARTTRNKLQTTNLACRDYTDPVTGKLVGKGSDMISEFAPTINDIGVTDGNVNYFRMPPNGSFNFRSHDGKFITKSLTGIADLGKALSETEDLYVCAASRYTKFFTGLDVPLIDFGAPGVALTPEQKEAKDFVVYLGKKLKESQSLRELIKDIISSANYKKDLVKRVGSQ